MQRLMVWINRCILMIVESTYVSPSWAAMREGEGAILDNLKREDKRRETKEIRMFDGTVNQTVSGCVALSDKIWPERNLVTRRLGEA